MNKWFRIVFILLFGIFSLYLATEYTKYKEVKAELLEKKNQQALLDARQKDTEQTLINLQDNKEKLLASQFTIDSHHNIYQNITKLASIHGIKLTSIKFSEDLFTITTEITASSNKKSWDVFFQYLKNEQKAVYLKSTKLEYTGEEMQGIVELIWYVENKKQIPTSHTVGQN
jgi:hypothetical protein